tara:strand:+ start:894 stop:1817 length:924 start_codon:yes stop_codon:yes gene_type:complete
MIKKTIQINPELFTIGGKKRDSKKKKKKLNPFSAALKPNDVKKQLINRVKEAQKRKKEKMIFDQKKETDDNFVNEFTNTVNYLETIGKEQQKKKKQKRQRKRRKKTIKATETAIDNIIKPAPAYGCLKNSSKPTYRQWKKTLKNIQENKIPSLNIAEDIERNQNKNERQNKLDELKNSFDKIISGIEPEEKRVQIEESEQIKKKRRRKHKTKKVKRKLTLGKNLKNRVVGVLIKNRTMRKKIKKENLKLHTKSNTVVRRYLLKHNLMKVGSSAPEDLLRSTYENSYLTGDVINKNPEILLHNYIQEA